MGHAFDASTLEGDVSQIPLYLVNPPFWGLYNTRVESPSTHLLTRVSLDAPPPLAATWPPLIRSFFSVGHTIIVGCVRFSIAVLSIQVGAKPTSIVYPPPFPPSSLVSNFYFLFFLSFSPQPVGLMISLTTWPPSQSLSTFFIYIRNYQKDENDWLIYYISRDHDKI